MKRPLLYMCTSVLSAVLPIAAYGNLSDFTHGAVGLREPGKENMWDLSGAEELDRTQLSILGVDPADAVMTFETRRYIPELSPTAIALPSGRYMLGVGIVSLPGVVNIY